MYKKALSLLLALMLIVTSLSVAVISVAASGNDASGLTVTADSNFFPTETQSFTQDQIDSNGGMVTVTYSIQSEENLLNTDWLLTYDGTVLQFDEEANTTGEGSPEEGVGDISKAMSSNVPYIKELEMTKGNTDSFLIYMYNLIAMVAIFGSMSGLTIAQNLQANLSDQAARRSCSAMPKGEQVLAELLSFYLSHSICVIIAITFITLALGVNFSDRLPLVYLGGVLGGIMGVSFGYFIGAIGKVSYGAKTGIIMALNMTLCFMSGLMVPGIKAMIIKYLPILNEINPVAIVSDSFYFLSVDPDLTRFWGKMVVVVCITVVFVLLGLLMTRRTKYASL